MKASVAFLFRLFLSGTLLAMTAWSQTSPAGEYTPLRGPASQATAGTAGGRPRRRWTFL